MSVHENSQPNLVSANKLTFASRLPESMLQHGDDRWVSAEPVVPADPKVVEVGNECADRCERRGLVKGEVRPAVRCRAPRIGAGRVVGGAGYTSEFVQERRVSGAQPLAARGQRLAQRPLRDSKWHRQQSARQCSTARTVGAGRCGVRRWGHLANSVAPCALCFIQRDVGRGVQFAKIACVRRGVCYANGHRQGQMFV